MIHRVKIERVSCDRCGVTATVEIGEVTGAYAIFPHAVDILNAAETELSALKEKLEKVREWAETVLRTPFNSLFPYDRRGIDDANEVLAILDGKEG